MPIYDSEQWDWGAGYCRLHRGQSLPCQTCISTDAPGLSVSDPEPLTEEPSIEEILSGYWTPEKGPSAETVRANVLAATIERLKADRTFPINHLTPAECRSLSPSDFSSPSPNEAGFTIKGIEKGRWLSGQPNPAPDNIPKIPMKARAEHMTTSGPSVRVRVTEQTGDGPKRVVCDKRMGIQCHNPEGEIDLPLEGCGTEALPPTMVSGSKTVAELADSLCESIEWVVANVVRFEMIAEIKAALATGVGFVTKDELTVPENELIRAWYAEQPKPTVIQENRVVRVSTRKPTEAEAQVHEALLPADMKAWDAVMMENLRSKKAYINKLRKSELPRTTEEWKQLVLDCDRNQNALHRQGILPGDEESIFLTAEQIEIGQRAAGFPDSGITALRGKPLEGKVKGFGAIDRKLFEEAVAAYADVRPPIVEADFDAMQFSMLGYGGPESVDEKDWCDLPRADGAVVRFALSRFDYHARGAYELARTRRLTFDEFKNQYRDLREEVKNRRFADLYGMSGPEVLAKSNEILTTEKMGLFRKYLGNGPQHKMSQADPDWERRRAIIARSKGVSFSTNPTVHRRLSDDLRQAQEETGRIWRVASASVQELPTKCILARRVPRYAPGGDAGDAALHEHVRRFGVLDPILIAPLTDTDFELIHGGRRLAAAKLVGKDTVPCLVVTSGDEAVAVSRGDDSC